ncbi:uncharacterized protein PG986_000091 [Apiospora aurea]|uniref:Uncharacterized protein n=1 Tax=Apiospora aurea TaxID=335848 RepID=A0ABR1QT25_9PEZI
MHIYKLTMACLAFMGQVAAFGLVNPGDRFHPTTLPTATSEHSAKHPARDYPPPPPTEVITVTAEPGAPAPSPTASGPSDADHNLRSLIIGSLNNARRRNRAHGCKNLSDDIFFNKTVTSLGFWTPESATHKNFTLKEVLERLVLYQDAYSVMQTQSERRTFPDNIVDEIRAATKLIQEDGELRGANARILRALDIIFDDVCGGTGEVQQVPDRVQDTVDVVLRGLAVNPQLADPGSQKPRPACECFGGPDVDLTIRYEWNRDAADWKCLCFTRQRVYVTAPPAPAT